MMMTKNQRIHIMRGHARKLEAGATFVEATMIVPGVVLLFIGTILFGLGLSQHARFTDGVRAASRAAVTTLGDCSAKQGKAEEVLQQLLGSQGLHYEAAEVHTGSMGGEEGLDKKGIKVKLKGKVMGFVSIEYKAFTGFEGGDDQDC